MGNSVPGNKANVGIAAGGEISASEAIVNVRSTGQGTQVGLMAGRATQFENESVQATANSACPTDAVGWTAPGPSIPVATVTPAPGSIESMMAQLRNMPPAAIGTLTGSHVVTGTSKRTAEIEAGATGFALPLIAGSTHVNNEEVTTIARGPTEKEKQLYTDSWKTTLLEYVDEDRYNIKGESHGLIISNTFDDPESGQKFGDRYKNIIRHGGKQDRKDVKGLFKHLNIKNIDDHENVKSDELLEILEDFKTRVEKNNGGLIFVVIMSHGGLERPDSVLMDDLVEVDARKQIIYALGDNDALRNTPKIFLFNMCRNSWHPWEPAKVEATPQIQSDSPSPLIQHSLRDALLLFTTLPYEVSLRDIYTGAVYISEMARIFKESAHKMTLRKMLYEVHTAVLQAHGQTPVVEDCLFKNVKFNVKS